MKSPHENVLCTPLCRFVVKLNDVCNFSFQLQTFKNFSQISKTLSTKSCHSCETTTRLLSVLRITLFHPSQKRGLECLLSIASVQTCGIEKYVCRNHVFAECFKQASVISSRFDVIDHFYRGIQHILQRSNNHISIATLQNQKRFLHLSNICTCCSLQFLTKQELLF